MHVTLPLPHRTEGVQADLAWPSYKQSVGQYDTLVCRYDDQDLGDPLFAAQSFDVIISSVSKSECLCKKTCVWWLRGTPPSQRPASMAAVASSCVRYAQVARVRTTNTHTHITPSPHTRPKTLPTHHNIFLHRNVVPCACAMRARCLRV
jgi:hypothetical protein